MSQARSDILTRDRLPSLTGLRFWAALLVVLYHLSSLVGPVQPFSVVAMFGRTGVTFFFVLSGFVLAWTYWQSPTPFVVFAWRRFARLWPLVAVTGILSLIAFRVVDEPIHWGRAATTFTFLQAWHPDWSVGANGAAWSLSDEAFFYMVFPLLLAVAVNTAGRRTLWTAVGVALPLLWGVFVLLDLPSWSLDYFPVSRVAQFALGVLCGVAMRRGARAPVGYWTAMAAVLAFHVALVPWYRLTGSDSAFGPYSGSQWWAAPFFALLIMAAADRDRAGRLTGVQGAWSIRLGHWSYAWYLIHEVIIRVWVHYVPHPANTAIVAAEWVTLLVMTVSVAAGLYAFVEHPAERWLRSHGPARLVQERTRCVNQPEKR